MTTASLPVTPVAMTDLSGVTFVKVWSRHAKDIHSLAKQILRDGLLNPIMVKRHGGKFVVVDGGKRLAAMQLLKRSGRLPRSLFRVPCIVSDSTGSAPALSQAPMLKTDAELARAINAARAAGQSPEAIAARFDCAPAVVNYAASTDALHPQIFEYFNSGHINLEQAAAFSGIESQDAQWRLLQELGPFAHAKDVIAAILAGKTVVDMPDGNIMIMPSRRAPVRPARLAA